MNWETDRLLIRSPKTEHHEGRILGLYQFFRNSDHTWKRPGIKLLKGPSSLSPARAMPTHSNLRTQLLRIIANAGLLQWPKLFQNLRSTRETELAETFPLHVVTTWLGNSQLVAAKRYLQVTDEHFQKATQNPT